MLGYNDIKPILNLPVVCIIDMKNSPDDLSVICSIEMPRKTHSCPSCQTETQKVHDYRTQNIRHTFIGRKPIILSLRKRRYVCPHCGKRFYETIPFLRRFQRSTNELQHEVFLALVEEVSSVSAVSKRYQISTPTAFRYFDRFHYPALTKLPSVLSIDEFKGNAGGEKFQCILTDPVRHQLLDILPTRKSEDLYAYFMGFSLKQRKKVRWVSMDMSTLFSSVIRRCFPRAKIIADKFHVVRLVNWALEKVRKREQKKFSQHRRKYFKKSRWLLLKSHEQLSEAEQEQLSIMLDISEDIRLAYKLKELFYQMMDSHDLGEAKARYERWIMEAEQAGLEEFKACIETIRKWSKPIRRGILSRITNGYTEGCNNKIKVLKRTSYGLRKFDRFRNRILYIQYCKTTKKASR